MREKIYFRYLWIIHKFFPSDKYFYSILYFNSQVLEFTNYSYSYLFRSLLRKSIPIPIHGKNNYLLITVKNQFWNVQKIPKALKLNKTSSKKILRFLVVQLLIFFSYWTYFVINQCNWCFKILHFLLNAQSVIYILKHFKCYLAAALWSGLQPNVWRKKKWKKIFSIKGFLN